MNKKILWFLLLAIFSLKNVYAFDVSNYKNRNLCNTFEVAGFHSDGVIDKVDCFSNYNDAKTFMKNNGAKDLAIMTRVNGSVKIIDANVALLDLSVNPETNTYFYTNSNLTGDSYTYMDTGSLYGGVDGVHLDTTYNNSGNWAAKVKIGNFTGWIGQKSYEIVPITWVKSKSSYTVTNSDIRHNYVAKIQNTYTGSAGRTIGPKPDMLSEGTYYSYDGHYFYTNLETLIKDNKKNSISNSVNKDKPYYNYYMYLSNHTKTAYSSVNIDEYVRNNLGYNRNVFGNAASDGTSRLYGMGSFFYYAQEKYGVNAILSLSLSRNETGNGRSNIAINKNNGFGLNADDANPYEDADWYASFASSILGYSSKWITYGYAHPRNWRYFGPQFGDKWIGMNVKYASDTYWSEKMAANYYSFDKAFGLQDYNYYQLGVVTGPTAAYNAPNTSARKIYTYPEKEDGVVIVGETTQNGEKWYEVVSDLNIDNNDNEITSGNYNWNKTVYVKANQVVKINNGKHGYISPKSTFAYQDQNYTYDLYDSGNIFQPKVAISTKDTPYYYGPTLTSKTGKTLLKDRYVMVYAVAYSNNIPVAYLVTSDYWYDQKEWVSPNSIRFTDTSYGKSSVTVQGNQYTWVNYNTEDEKYSLISGLYTNTYVPVLDTIKVGSNTWYKVPVDLTTSNHIYGYTLASAPGVKITLSKATVVNSKPVINAKDKSMIEGDAFDPKKDVSAYDAEDGDLTNKIEVIENNVNNKTPGTYKVTYKVMDNKGEATTLSITVTVKENKAPVIVASNKELTIGSTFDPKKDVSASDTEDGDLTSKIKVVENTVNTEEAGEYQVIYEVVDTKNKKTTKEIKVIVKEKEEDPPTTPNETIDEEEIDIDELLEKQREGEFYLENISWDKSNKVFTISGYQIILDSNNSSSKEYGLILVDKNSDDAYYIEIPAWKKDTPYDLGNDGSYSYTNSWFKGELDFTDIPNGDYDLYMIAEDQDAFTVSIVNNYFNQDIMRRGEDSHHGYNFKVNQKNKNKPVELSIRDELYTVSEAPTSRNMVNGYDEITFRNNKLYLYGYSYDFNGIYNNQLSITRKVIFERQDTYQQEVYDVGSVKGPFALETLDGRDKTYAWFEKELDISNLEVGTYTLYVYTKTSNAENYDEIVDVLKMLKEETTINDKNYKITYNRSRGNRIELTIKEA